MFEPRERSTSGEGMRYTSDTPAPPLPQSYTAAAQSGSLRRGLPRFATTIMAVAFDSICILLGMTFGLLSWQLIHGKVLSDGISLTLLLSLQYALIFIFLARAYHVYSQSHKLLQVRDTEIILRISCFTFITLAVEIYVRKLMVPRIMFSVGCVTSVLLLLIQKHLTRPLLINIRSRAAQRMALIIGTGRDARRLFSYLHNSPDMGITPVAFVDETQEEAGGVIYGHDYVHRSSAPILAGEVDGETLTTMGISEIYIAGSNIAPSRLDTLIRLARYHQVNLSFVGGGHSIEREREPSVTVADGLLITSYNSSLQVRRFYDKFKRTFDLVLAGLLLILTAPTWLIIALWIRMTSKGPIFFKQRRTGLHGKPFDMLKFRSMYVDAPVYASSPQDSKDKRITPAGRILRKTSLDELPQLLNILRGDMSLVGPRPEMPFVTEQYTPVERLRLSVPQGLTGFWQLSADRKYSIHESLEYDLYYIENRGFFLDLAIVLHTVLFAMKGI